ncbi:MAG: hypothetical protein GXO78_08590 [Calditrichaeota bacterium]|nr:hypothetical protein [Calditrichota bacterium]
MKIGYLGILMSLFLGVGPLMAQSQDDDKTTNLQRLVEVDQCVACHIDEEALPEGLHENDIHLRVGLSCAGCHGGDPTSDDMDIAMDPARGYVGIPDKREVPRFCGKCHSDINFMRQFRPQVETDQEEQYYTSRHGKLLLKGDTKVAVCTDCHTSHAVFPASDPRSSVYPTNVPITCKKCHSDPDYMASYKIPTDQFEKYAESVHGQALLKKKDVGAPACNDCHGNHGALPPGVTSIGQVCGNCHINNLQYFQKTKMAEEFKKMDLHDCIECHGYHSVPPTNDDMVGVGEQSTCIDCHDEGDEGYKAAVQIRQLLLDLTTAIDSAKVLKKRVQIIGMDDLDIEYLLKDAHQQLIHARTVVHTFDPKQVEEKTKTGLERAKEAIQLALEEIKEYHRRRKGFLFATLFTTLLIIGLFIKLRQIESEQKSES